MVRLPQLDFIQLLRIAELIQPKRRAGLDHKHSFERPGSRVLLWWLEECILQGTSLPDTSESCNAWRLPLSLFKKFIAIYYRCVMLGIYGT